jgi:hypothetical protein
LGLGLGGLEKRFKRHGTVIGHAKLYFSQAAGRGSP